MKTIIITTILALAVLGCEPDTGTDDEVDELLDEIDALNARIEHDNFKYMTDIHSLKLALMQCEYETSPTP